ncbi:MAG: hypothetical protein JXN65_12135 [Clostridia bacterium]|nr:hypothetical protein [Clostridia bacterium]
MEKEKKRTKVVVLVLFSLVILFLGFMLVLKNKMISNVDAEGYLQKDYTIRTPSIENDEEEQEEVLLEVKYDKGLFSWGPATIKQGNKEDLYEIINILGIDEVYQYFEVISYDDTSAAEFAGELDEMNVDLYILAGSSTWTYKPDGAKMLNEINRAVSFRERWGEGAITGIVFDIEPYDSEKWSRGKQEVLMENYIAGMKIAYEAAKEQNLRVIICIPSWYDADYNSTLLELIKYCDEISVMNYNRNNEYGDMENEIEYAREYDKYVTCIFEFQAVGQYNLTEEQTYNNLGTDEAQKSFESVFVKAQYEKLKFAYHYLEPLKEMLLD